MYPYPNPYQYPAVAVPVRTADQASYLRKVYAYFTLSVIAASAGALASLYLGTDASKLTLAMPSGAIVAVPPLIHFFANHWIIGGLLFLGSVLGASAVRLRPGVNTLALTAMGFVSGLIAAPAIWITQILATQGQTLTASPVRDTFLLTTAGFVGLTSYALISRKDFSFLRGFVSMGLWVVLGAIVLSIFVKSSAFALAIASAGVLLFGAFILYDTSRLLRRPEERPDPVGAAISIYLNVLNLFLFLLTIFRGSRQS